ncbi:hypothetical protein DDV21_001895 [Streptococcus chenjunshii]|uniref:Uncharacterized protein n=1 Tax=Streptococcus chenjunshii TaxID=2173853 RepID=A0A372KQL3_9STRE|nr:hypothetical protein DDV21_001895 [Streptococcus chenjunshii]RFU51850.1 hypothetical protein DDV22_01880 [Streptococcus chenjunshii]RFU53938.1 hypothetical protein DDV23_02380 [Streptococcus chenjunshii]
MICLLKLHTLRILILVFGLIITMNVLNGWAEQETFLHHAFSVFVPFFGVYLVGVAFYHLFDSSKGLSSQRKIKERKKKLN